MTGLASAFLSVWGIGAGIFLVAAAGALTIRGLARTLGTIAGLSLAAVCGAVAIEGTESYFVTYIFRVWLAPLTVSCIR